MASDQLPPEGSIRYVKMHPDPAIAVSSSHSFRLQEQPRIFDELPKADIVSVSRPDAGDISPMLLSYTIEFRYKQVVCQSLVGATLDHRVRERRGEVEGVEATHANDAAKEDEEFKWRLVKKASQVLYLHLNLKKRAFIEEFHEKQEQVKEWLQNLGLGEHAPIVQDDDEADDEPVPLLQEEHLSAKNRNVPSSAALPIIRPALGRQHSISDRAKVAMRVVVTAAGKREEQIEEEEGVVEEEEVEGGRRKEEEGRRGDGGGSGRRRERKRKEEEEEKKRPT
ncbi:phospholipase D [Musa troglodytarum]|uniref:Phospholipase D n=1 Tax=Musa troglodytarum TaxID=320322 RepID=A0A9E7JNR1_9LILI|nr:phospholipase D [Musa troglodytarum]